ncbi:MAG: ABC transporter permease [Micavibrio sp.]|nr:ABC transporter permease [Micavibrio sp.]
MQFIENRQGNDAQAVALKGDWIVENSSVIEDDAHSLKKGGRSSSEKTNATVDFSGIGQLDTVGAWLIQKYFPKAKYANMTDRQKALMDFVPESHTSVPQPECRSGTAAFFVHIGGATVWAAEFVWGIFCFLGEVFIRIFRNLRHPSHFRPTSITRHIYETGVLALPIISLLAFGISMVVAYQGANQLQKFGADIYTIDLTVVSVLREMAVLMTAIMVAGRSGSAFAAEIGVMKMRGEIDALRTMGMDPIEVLVIPRLLALLVTLPALAFIADIVGLAAGAFMSLIQLKVSLSQYIDRVQAIATPLMFFIGMIKAPVFALLITAVCTYQGMSAKGSAEDVGKLTTLAVVQSIFLVIMADAIFSILFAQLGL